jgi:two-component system response regulator GlrR
VAEFGKPARNFSPEAMQKLLAYNWPGNVRELEHVVQRATLLSEHPLIQEADIILSDSKPPGAAQETFQEAKMKLIKEFEKSFIQKLLLANQGNVSKAARAANKNRRAFWQLICKHQIDVQRFRVAFK